MNTTLHTQAADRSRPPALNDPPAGEKNREWFDLVRTRSIRRCSSENSEDASASPPGQVVAQPNLRPQGREGVIRPIDDLHVHRAWPREIPKVRTEIREEMLDARIPLAVDQLNVQSTLQRALEVRQGGRRRHPPETRKHVHCLVPAHDADTCRQNPQGPTDIDVAPEQLRPSMGFEEGP